MPVLVICKSKKDLIKIAEKTWYMNSFQMLNGG